MSPSIDAEIDRLYGKRLDEFTAARDALARDLRRAGDSSAADEVKALRKPTVSAWAINQLARNERMKVRSLLVGGEKLRSAHAELLGGGQPAKVAEARDAERKVISHLVSSAAKILAEAGHSPSEAMLERVASTLRAAAVDDDGRLRLERGRLTRDLDPSGFGPLGTVATPTGRAKGDSRRAQAEDRGAQRRKKVAEEKASALRAELSELTKAAADADALLAKARQGLRAAEAEAKAARRKVERAARRLEAADRELAQPRRR